MAEADSSNILNHPGGVGGSDDVEARVADIAARARQASRALAAAGSGVKSAALHAIAGALDARRDELKAANGRDLARSGELDQPLRDRLGLDDGGIDRMIEGVLQVDALPDPVGAVSDLAYRPSGIQVGRMRVPLGVIGIIYESRPNVTVDAAVLCLKSGNACVLRGGSEAIESNRAIAACVQQGLRSAGLPADAVQLIDTTDRAAVGAMLRQDEHIDVIVPRGGKGLIERISRETRIPVIKHLDGVCHLYIDSHADAAMAVALAVNSKTEKYAVCNALETLLIDRSRAVELLPQLGDAFEQAGVRLRGCQTTCELLTQAEPATEADWYEEYLGPTLALKVVDGLEEAIAHINHYGSQHTDCIVTDHYDHGRRFLREVDSASVLINSSTQFADGFEYGLGAEIGISTDKLHARGPVGLEGLTTQKFVVFGNGEIRRR